MRQESLSYGPQPIISGLCELPLEYFIEPRLQRILFPTLIAATHGSERNSTILQEVRHPCCLRRPLTESGPGAGRKCRLATCWSSCRGCALTLKKKCCREFFLRICVGRHSRMIRRGRRRSATRCTVDSRQNSRLLLARRVLGWVSVCADGCAVGVRGCSEADRRRLEHYGGAPRAGDTCRQCGGCRSCSPGNPEWRRFLTSDRLHAVDGEGSGIHQEYLHTRNQESKSRRGWPRQHTGPRRTAWPVRGEAACLWPLG